MNSQNPVIAEKAMIINGKAQIAMLIRQEQRIWKISLWVSE